jgi:hypothetical protein
VEAQVLLDVPQVERLRPERQLATAQPLGDQLQKTPTKFDHARTPAPKGCALYVSEPERPLKTTAIWGDSTMDHDPDLDCNHSGNSRWP